MSIVGERLQIWLGRNISVMHQEASVCDALPPDTRKSMIDISIKSASKNVEMGAAITKDYTLGNTMTGTTDRVPIPRMEGVIGTFHTHTNYSPFPSPSDTFESMYRDDKIMCIGVHGHPGTKIQCFTPNKEKWDALQYRLKLLVSDVLDYNKRIGNKYAFRGRNLQRLLEHVGSPVFKKEIEYTTPDEFNRQAVIAEKSADEADDAVIVSQVQADKASDAVIVARETLSKATGDEALKAKMELREKEDEARRAAGRVVVYKELADNARVAANIAIAKSKAVALGKENAATISRDASETMYEAGKLATRRNDLAGEVKRYLRELASPKEWKALKWTDGFTEAPFFEVYPNILNKCRVIWEELEEELPYEL